MPAGSPSIPSSAVNQRELLKLLRALQGEEQHPDVIRLIEKWGQQGPLPREASLAQAQAFLALRLMDRAWVRLRELTDTDPDDVDALLMTAEMFLERGWPARARRVLARARDRGSSDDRLASLERRAAEPPLRPPPNARELERHGSPEQLVWLAERYLATGSLLRGKSLLERVRRIQPDSQRVEQLLWAMRGEFGPHRESLTELVIELGGEDLSAEWDGNENTESISVADITAAGGLAPVENGRQDAPFPLLFRRSSRTIPGDVDEREVTVTSRLASSAELADAPEMQHTDPHGMLGLDDDPDTRIMEVISNRSGEMELVPVEGSPRKAVDLRALQEEADGQETDFLEDEDQDLVVMTRREKERGPAARTTPRAQRAPIKVIEKHPIPLTSPGPELTPLELDDDLPEPAAGAWSRAILALVAMGIVLTLGAGLLYWGMRTHARGELVERTHAALASGNFQELRSLEAQLTGQIEAGLSPVGARAAELALLNAVLWADYTGDPDDRDQAIALLEQASDAGALEAELALSRGILAMVRGDTQAAAQEAVDVSWPEGRYLEARVAAAQGRTEEALAIWADGEPSSEPRYLPVQALLLQEAGQFEKAAAAGGALLREHSDPLLLIAAHENRWVSQSPEARLESVTALLKEHRRELSPRHRGRLQAIEAELNEELGREAAARRAWQQALDSDGYHPRYLYEIASRELAESRALDAADRLSRCLGVRPVDGDCQRARLMALLELDRMEAAQQEVSQWETAQEAGASITLLQAWLDVADGRANDALDALTPLLTEDADGLPWYLAGMAMGHLGDASATTTLLRASELLAESEHVELRALSARAQAALVEYGSRAQAAQLASTLRTAGSTDPHVHLHLGRYFDRIGRRTDSAQHLARAGELADQSARVLFELGLFYYGPRTPWAYDLWQRYLQLAPSGDRAERTRERLQR